MGWETHGVCVKSDGGWLGEVHHSVTSKKKIMLLDYFKRYTALSYPPTLSTLTFNVFFHLPPTHVCRDSRTETHQSNTWQFC